MTRRDMLKSSALAVLVTHVPALAGQKAGERTSALDPLPDYLERYGVPDGPPSDPERAQELVFDLIEWRVGRQRTTVTNVVIGNLKVQRVPGGSQTTYRTVRTIAGEEALVGEFTCAHDAWRSVRSWRLEHRLARARTPNQKRLVATEQVGHVTQAGYTLHRDGGERSEALPGPLTCRYGLIDVLPGMDLGRAGSVAVVDDAAGVRRNQHFRLHGAEGVADRPVRSILRTGRATLPTHWVIDEGGRPLFITRFLLSLALVHIE